MNIPEEVKKKIEAEYPTTQKLYDQNNIWYRRAAQFGTIVLRDCLLQEFERLKQNAPNLKEMLFLDAVMAVISTSIENSEPPKV